MLTGWFMWFIIIWIFILIILVAIGGYFMFRKFLKSMPKDDGKSTLDWQDHYIELALPLWHDDAKQLLNELVTPVPELFRDVAKTRIAAQISKIALAHDATRIEHPHIIQGYIEATPKRDHKFLRKKLTELNIDFTAYTHYFD